MTRWLSMVLVLSASMCPSLYAKSEPKHCFSIAQNLLTGPTPQTTWLTTEIPPNATFVSVSYWARPRIPEQAPPWQSCPTTGGWCLSPAAAYFPPAQGAGGGGIDNPNSNTRNWSLTVTGPPQAFNGDTWVRLTVEYTTTEPVCVSQQSFESPANSNFQGRIIVPAGKSPTSYTMFGAIPLPGEVWHTCGVTTNLGQVPEPCFVPPLQLNFVLTQLSPDEADHADEVLVRCEDKNFTTVRRCRIAIEYAP